MKSKRTVLVTGCSSGIGLATCHVLSRNNFMTYGTVRNLSKAKKIQDLINMENLSLKILRLDVNDNQSIKLAVKKILTDTGRIDVLINNAGYGMFGAVEDRKSTRLNSSHLVISYAVFCLKKKKK